MKYKDFEDFVQNEHCEQYIGTKDGCVEDYEYWICELDADEWLALGDKYAKTIRGNNELRCLFIRNKRN